MGKILIIKNADFSKVAVGKVDPVGFLNEYMQEVYSTIALRGTTQSGGYEYEGNPWRACGNIIKCSDYGFHSGDYVKVILPKDYMYGLRSGDSATNLSYNDYWSYTSITPGSQACQKQSGQPIDDSKEQGLNYQIKGEYMNVIFSPTTALGSLNIETIKRLILNKEIVVEKV